MELVADRWYRLYNWLLVLFGLCMVGAFVVSRTLILPEMTAKLLSFNPLIVILGTVNIVYGLSWRKLAAKQGIWLINVLAMIVYMLSIFFLIKNTGGFQSPYIILWALLLFAAGLHGYYINAALALLSVLLFLLMQPNNNFEINVYSLAFLLGGLIIAPISYMFWRRRYIGPDTQLTKELAVLVSSKEQQSAALIYSIADSVVLLNDQGMVSKLNPAAIELSGWESKDANNIDPILVFKFVDETGQEITEESNPFKTIMASMAPIKCSLRLIRSDKTERFVSLVISPIIVPESKSPVGAIAILRDISDEQAEETRREDFISTASHEMRTPVAAIEGYLALALNDKVSTIDAKARSYLEKAHSSTQGLGKLFQDLLASTKAEDGRLANHPVAIEMGDFLEQLTDGLRFGAEKKGLLMDFVIGSNSGRDKVVKPLYYANVDPDRLGEVVTNLFDNAVKYTETGRITVGLTGNNQVVQLYIKDTGPGIPATDLPHLFQKFYRVDSSATRTIGGTGLGLFICRKIIELYNGRIWVESEPGRGSTFYINLPRLNSMQAGQMQTADTSTRTTTLGLPAS